MRALSRSRFAAPPCEGARERRRVGRGALACLSFALALLAFSPALAQGGNSPDVDRILAQARTAFSRATNADAMEVIAILCRTNLTLLSLKERDGLMSRAFSLLKDNKFDEANEIFARVRELEKSVKEFGERACRPPDADKTATPKAAGQAAKTEAAQAGTQGTAPAPSIVDPERTPSTTHGAAPDAATSPETKSAVAPPAGIAAEADTAKAPAASEGAKPMSAPAASDAASTTIPSEPPPDETLPKASEEANDRGAPSERRAGSSPAPAAPSAPPPEVASTAPPIPAEAERTISLPNEVGMIASATASAGPAIDSGSSAKIKAEMEKPEAAGQAAKTETAQAGTQGTAPAPSSVDSEPTPSMTHSAAPDAATSPETKSAVAPPAGIAAEADTAKAPAASEGAKPMSAPAASDAASTTIPSEPRPDETLSKATEEANDRAERGAGSSPAPAAPSAPPPEVTSTAPPIPAEAERTISLPNEVGMIASATASAGPAIDSGSSAKITAEMEKPAQAPSEVGSVEPTASTATAVETANTAPTRSSPPETAPLSAGDVAAAVDATTGATSPRRPEAEAAAPGRNVTPVEAPKPTGERRLAALSPPSAPAETRPAASAKNSPAPKRQSRPSFEQKDRIIHGRSPGEISKRVARAFNQGPTQVEERSLTLRGATSREDTEQPPLQVAIHRRCPSILARQDEYDDELVSLCGRWSQTR